MGIIFNDMKRNMMETILTCHCQRISAGYSNPQLQPGDAVLFRTFEEWTQPDPEIDPIMESLDEYVIYQAFSTEKRRLSQLTPEPGSQSWSRTSVEDISEIQSS